MDMTEKKFQLKALEEYDKQAGIAIVHLEDAREALTIMKDSADEMNEAKDAAFLDSMIDELEEVEEKVHSVR